MKARTYHPLCKQVHENFVGQHNPEPFRQPSTRQRKSLSKSFYIDSDEVGQMGQPDCVLGKGIIVVNI